MISGSCLCGGVRFEATEVPLIVLCHCSMCRKANGAAFDAGAVVPSANFKLANGADLVETYESSPRNYRAFCRVCGSRVPSQTQDGRFYWVPAGLFDDDPGVKPALHMFVGSKAPWWDINDSLPQFEGWVPGYGPTEES